MLKWWCAVIGALIGIALFYIGIAGGQILRFSGGSVLPPGVTLRAPDGGTSFFGTSGYTNASASITQNGTTYSNGWDSPGWFPLGPWFPPFTTQADANRYFAQNLNMVVNPVVASGQLNLLQSNGISLIGDLQYLGQTSLNDTRVWGSETVGVLTYDEPQSTTQSITGPIAGIPQTTLSATISSGLMTVSSLQAGGTIFSTGGFSFVNIPYITGAGVTSGMVANSFGTGVGRTGTYGVCIVNESNGTCGGGVADVASSTEMTQTNVPALQNSVVGTRFIYTNFTNKEIRFGTLLQPDSSSLSMAGVLNLTAQTSTLATRHTDIASIDLYWFVEGNDAGVHLSNTNQTLSNVYDTSGGSPPMTLAQAAKGSHYGDIIDFVRAWYTVSGPVYTYIENGNCNCQVPYDIQPVEINWAVWGSIIHGARGIIYFDEEDAFGPSGCTNGDNFNCTYFQGAQNTVCTSCTYYPLQGVLTVSTITHGLFAPGMQTSAGASTILQQASNFPVPGNVGNYVVSSSPTGSPLTFAQPSSMVSAVASTNGLVKTLAPVINSPFALGLVTPSPSGYVFPTSVGQTFSAGISTGIEVMAKYYQGGTYVATTGDTINNGFYIFSDTRFPETSTNISATFTLAGTWTKVNVINESRSINMTGGNTFTDTFANAWTVHIYQVVP